MRKDADAKALTNFFTAKALLLIGLGHSLTPAPSMRASIISHSIY